MIRDPGSLNVACRHTELMVQSEGAADHEVTTQQRADRDAVLQAERKVAYNDREDAARTTTVVNASSSSMCTMDSYENVILEFDDNKVRTISVIDLTTTQLTINFEPVFSKAPDPAASPGGPVTSISCPGARTPELSHP